MTLLRPALSWQAHHGQRAVRPPLRPRVPLWWGAGCIGSVEPELVERSGLAGWALLPHQRQGELGWRLHGDDLSATLAAVAAALRERDLCHVWRDELLAVRDEAGRMLGAVERAATRVLGVATDAVHLAAVAEDGRHWVQRRALDKPTDPGLWDTLVGGAIPASDTLEQALARETWEEAGLRLAQVRDLRHGGRVRTQRPADVAHGYVVEWLDWFTCTLPAGVEPRNQDGEVAEFCRMDAPEVTQRLERDEFTIDAAQVLLAAYSP
ncbi:NUDIX domain-containing protein [Ramlibacter sp.]|uniref:NUDIX hydrolase n=1 Tax=Ramlibacter sp. TaxID=1917967 RepID=UPI00260D77BB|nr:NUDIX domain-containing protein [Ramlibacter sp.]MDB5955832.1 Nudix hydrolase-like protein [Ramlibacter sp.]